MKKHIQKAVFILVASLAAQGLFAQQRSLLSQYMINELWFNPAVAGTTKLIPIQVAVRRQWVGIREAPVTQVLSGHGYVGKNFGIGANFVNQVAGPSRRFSFEFCTAYHIDLSKEKGSKEKLLSFGLSGVLQQYVIDRTQLTTDQPNDNAILNVPANQVIPEANFGVWYTKKDKFAFGFTATNLFQTRRFLNPGPYNVFNALKRTYYLYGRYRFKLNDNLALEPSLMLYSMEPLLKISFRKGDFAIPFQMDVNSRILFKDMFYAGVSYRFKDAIIGMAGFQRPSFRIGYSYDYTLAPLTNYNSGSHEVSLTIFLEAVERSGGSGKFRRGQQIPRRTLQFKRD